MRGTLLDSPHMGTRSHNRPRLSTRLEIFRQDYLALRGRLVHTVDPAERSAIQAGLLDLGRSLRHYHTRMRQYALNDTQFEGLPEDLWT